MGQLSDGDRFVLTVAHMLVSLDGKMSSLEKDAFSQVAQSFNGYVPGESDANRLISEAHGMTQKILPLMDSYSEDDYVTCFINTIKEHFPVFEIGIGSLFTGYRLNIVSIRNALFVWIGLALSDREYSSLERKVVDRLRMEFNELRNSEDKIPKELLIEIEDASRILVDLSNQQNEVAGKGFVLRDDPRRIELEKNVSSLKESIQSLIQFG